MNAVINIDFHLLCCREIAVFLSLLQTVTVHYEHPLAVVVDAVYKTISITPLLREQDILAVFSYSLHAGVKGMAKKKDFFYDAYYDCHLYENNQILRY